MTLEKNRYSAAMDKLHVTPEERERLLERALEQAQQQKTAPRAVHTHRRWAPLTAAACICLVLAGVEGGDCLLADPLSGSTRVDKDAFERIYTAMGSRALAVG